MSIAFPRSRRGGKPRDGASMTPFVSVIMPVRNEVAHIAATLDPLLHQCYDPCRYEILVIDGQSTDATADIVRELQLTNPQLQLLDNPKRLASAARNIGVQQARGDYLVIVDGHCEIRSKHYLRDLVRAFEEHSVDCLGRPQPLDVAGAAPLQKAIAVARASRLGHNPGSHIYSKSGGPVKPQSVGVAYRKELFERVGLFDETFDACEDVEFNHRVDAAGFRCHLAPELAIHYLPRDTLGGLAHQMQRYGRGRVRLITKHPTTFSLLPLIPALFLVGIFGSFFLGLTSPIFASLFCVCAIVYMATVAGAGLWLALKRRAAEAAPLIPIVFLTIHVGAGYGVLAESMPRVSNWLIRHARPILRRTNRLT
ncbi:MAG: glycosyltransferase family 2 protein [Gemmataceae bacterium]